MMRVIRLWTLALLALAVVLGTGAPALANTEGVPGSRLVFPYIDISGGRETFLMLTNSSGSMLAPVHIQFYAQNCQRFDLAVTLTPQDTAAVQVSVQPGIAAFPAPGPGPQQNIAGIGWADVDVRDLCSASLLNCAGVEYNGLMGEAIVVDVAGGFLFSYPAAPSQGFAAGGFTSKTTIVGGNTVTVPTGPIVSRNAAGAALSWTGAYETYPSTNLIPTFFAEDPCAAGGPAPKGGPALTAYISLVGSADAWRKEAPGQDLGVSTTLVSVDGGRAFDGAENFVSFAAFAHHVNGRLCTVFPTIHPRTLYHNPPIGFYADVDVTLGATNAVGWLELTNTVHSPSSTNSGPVPNPNFTAANGFDTSVRPRGMVGLLFEIQPKTPSPKAKPSDPRGADAVRSWADPASQIDWPCFGSETIDRGEFTVPGGVSPPTIVPGLNTPTCDKEPSVAPTWLRDHAQTLNGGGGAGK